MEVNELMRSEVVLRAGWMLLHSLWQGAAVCLGTGAALWMLRRGTASVRYLVTAGAMALMVALPVVTFFVMDVNGVPGNKGAVVVPAPIGAVSPPLEVQGAAAGHVTAPVLVRPPRIVEGGLAAAKQPSVVARQATFAETWEPRVSRVIPYLTFAWGCGVVLLSLWQIGGWITVQRLRVVGVARVPQRIEEMLARLAARLGIRRPVRLMESTRVEVPMLIGMWKPVILLPPAMLMGLSMGQLEAILSHELAHVRRHDYLALLLQSVTETLLFYHPGVWWLSRRMGLEREQCCDDIAVEVCGDRQSYAGALAAIEELRIAAPVLAASGNGARELMTRIARLLGGEAPRRPGRTAIAGVVLLGVIALALVIMMLAIKPGNPGISEKPTAHADAEMPRTAPGNPVNDVQAIGGRVVDQEGKPLAGARVMVEVSKTNTGASWVLLMRPIRINADADGRWELAGVPMGGKIEIGASHPDCMGAGGSFAMDEYKDVPALLAKTGELKLTRGVALEGLVRGPDGKPVANARVAYGESRVSSFTVPPERVKEDGTFHLGAPAGSEVVLTIKAAGFAPELKRINVEHEAMKVIIDMQPGKRLNGRVVDKEGKPISGATVFFDTWRGARTLGNQVTSDGNGQFAWSDAPEDEMLVDVLTQAAYASNRRMRVKAGEENIITLIPVTHFKGKVVGEATGEAIKTYDVKQGIQQYPQDQVSWEDASHLHLNRSANDGEFEVVFSEPYPAMIVRVEAAGYKSADSAPIAVDGKTSAFTFKLEKGAGVEGILVNADGKPLKAAQVYLADGSRQIQIDYGTRMIDERAYTRSVTDDAGHFAFPPQAGSYTLLIARAEGVAIVRQVEFEKTHVLTLQKWGRIEGEARTGTHPATQGEISANSEALPETDQATNNYAVVSNQVRVDDTGKFVIEQVFPGKVGVELMLGNGRNYAVGTNAYVDVKAGETAHVQLGGKGTPVAGKLGAVVDERMKGAVPAAIGLSSVTHMPELSVLTPEVMEMSQSDSNTWLGNFYATEEGKKYLVALADASRRKSYSTPAKPDGTFRIDDVAPGTYRLSVSWNSRSPDPRGGQEQAVGAAGMEMVVPEAPGGVTDQPIDVGELAPVFAGPLAVGDMIPDHVFSDFEGKPVKLESSRGKYLLLVEWGTFGREYLPPPQVAEIWEKYKADPRFAMLGLPREWLPNSAKTYVKARGIPWPMVNLAGDRLVLQWFPTPDGAAAWLVGPDGNIIAGKLKGDEIKAAVDKALAK